MVGNRKRGAGAGVVVFQRSRQQNPGMSRALLDRHLVACVNMTPAGGGYRWKGDSAMERTPAHPDTRREMAETVIRELEAGRRCRVPEIIVAPGHSRAHFLPSMGG